jgi:3-oxoacyl-[acyl-carrier protein] reductase
MPVAVVTGAASGIGAATVAELRATGWSVVGLDRRPGPEIVVCDVGEPDAIAAAFAMIGRRHPRLQALVNNAGIMIEAGLGEMSVPDFDRLMATNLRGPFLVAQAALPLLRDGGAIVNVASELAYLGRAKASAYGASKGAMLSLTRAWARELARASASTPWRRGRSTHPCSTSRTSIRRHGRWRPAIRFAASAGPRRSPR